jgi:hypothetical protein
MPKKVMPLTDAKIDAMKDSKGSINAMRLKVLADIPIPRVPFSGAKIRNEVPADIRDGLPK